MIDKVVGEKCETNLRWNDGVLQQLWAIIEYREGREYERSWEWRDVPNLMPARSPQGSEEANG